MAQGEIAQALRLFKDVCRNRIVSLGRDHIQTAVSHIFLGRAFYQVGSYAESLQEYSLGIKNLSSWINHDSKFMTLLASEYQKVCQQLGNSSTILLSEENLPTSDSSSGELFEDLKSLIKTNEGKDVFRDKGDSIEEMSNSYLRDQLEVLDIGLFDLSVLHSFEVSKD